MDRVEKVQYTISVSFCNSNRIIVGETDTKNMHKDISSELAYMMIYKSKVKFTSFNDYKKSENPNIVIDVIVTIDNIKKKYTINENLLMYIYGFKFDEYYVESEYEISDWAISSTDSSSSSSSSKEYEV